MIHKKGNVGNYYDYRGSNVHVEFQFLRVNSTECCETYNYYRETNPFSFSMFQSTNRHPIGLQLASYSVENTSINLPLFHLTCYISLKTILLFFFIKLSLYNNTFDIPELYNGRTLNLEKWCI